MTPPHSLVIGGTRGIGQAIVSIFQKQDHEVSVIGRQAPPTPLPSNHGLKYWAVDLMQPECLIQALDDILDQRGGISNLVFCQRYRGDGDSWSGELEVTLNATRIVVDRLSASLGEHGTGAIVLVGSLLSSFVGSSQYAGYHVAKAAALQLMRYYAIALAPTVRCNVVTPGVVLKDEAREYYSEHQSLPDLMKRITPLGRMTSPQDVADAVSFLCGPQASFITGQNLVVDGGLSLEFSQSLAMRLTV